MISSIFYPTIRSLIRLLITLFFSASFFYTSAEAIEKTTPPTPPTPSASSAILHTEKHMKGTITAFSPTSLTILNKKTNTSHTFHLSPKTSISTPETPVSPQTSVSSGTHASAGTAVFRSCHCQGTLNDLAVGQHVRVKFSPEDLKASNVHIWKHHKSQKSKECTCPPSEKSTNMKKHPLHNSP